MPTNIRNFEWGAFWEDCEDIPEDVEGIIYRTKSGQWKTVFVCPNSFEVITVAVQFNPFTGEKLK